MDTMVVKNLAEYWGYIQNFDLLSDHMLYRGQAYCRGLLPGIARQCPTFDSTSVEKKMLAEFRRVGQLKMRGHDQDELSLMILAQHYGMQTRLLDWTSNPLAALWFACSEVKSKAGDGYVYAAEADNHMLLDRDESPFEIKQTSVIRPNLGNDRIVAQHGWFTLHRYSNKFGGFRPLERMLSGALNVSMEIKIPEKFRSQILFELDRCGINSSTLLPDLAGLCAYLNWQHLK